MSTVVRAVLSPTNEKGRKEVTIQTNLRNLIGSTTMKALAVSLLVSTLMTASLLAPTQAKASAFPGANGKIVFSSTRSTGTGVNNPEGDTEIFTMNPDGTALKQLTTNKATDSGPSYSSDGKKIVFHSQRTGNFEIFSMNADGTGQKNLTKDAASDTNPSFSPDGRTIVFESTRAGDVDIFVMNVDGTNLADLTPVSALDKGPVFSPGGNEIAFQSSRDGGDFDIFVMSPNGSNPIDLTLNDSVSDAQPVYSPDGKKIAFASNSSGVNGADFNILVMNADGTGRQTLNSNASRQGDPAFSPDGQQIAYASTQNGGDEDIFVMNASPGGFAQTPLTSNNKADETPDWQPKAATFTVTSADDPGDGTCNSTCTLREAINASNTLGDSLRNTIKFDISGTGVHTITLVGTALPKITRPVMIDGYTQPGASPNTLTVGDNAALRIELNGTNVNGSGLELDNVSNSVIRGLVINQFNTGIVVQSPNAAGNRIEGNFIGTDPAGAFARGNEFGGVTIFSGATQNVVGGSTPAARNVISANRANGISLSNASDNNIQGNYVGTDKSGTRDLGNDGTGILVGGGSGNTIGGITVGSRNLVSGNHGNGVSLSESAKNAVIGNLIGTNISGTGALSNDLRGVALFFNSNSNKIGNGTSSGSNTIAFSGLEGVVDSGTGNEISRNSIFANAGLGIDLNGDGVTANDGDNPNTPQVDPDSDAGPNNLQNFPVLSSAKTVSGKTTIAGKLISTPGKTFKIQFFSNPKGTNEGKKFIGQKSVSTDGSGAVTFTFSLATAVKAGTNITATATDPAGNTSEFSAPRTVGLASGSDLSPETTRLSGPSGVTTNPTAHFKFESSDPKATFECSLDGGDYYPCSSPENIHGLSESRHAFEVRAVDERSNQDPSPAAWIWAVERNR
jgi:CSLREA domain-containing protein